MNYNIIYADPPWQFQVRVRKSGLARAPDAHYETMPTSHIMTFIDEKRIAIADDAILVM